MSKALAVVNMQRGFDIEELIEETNEAISLAERQEVPIIFTMDSFGEEEYEEPWELSPRLDVQSDHFAKNQKQYDELLDELQVEEVIVVGNLEQGEQFVREGVVVDEATRGSIESENRVSILEL